MLPILLRPKAGAYRSASQNLTIMSGVLKMDFETITGWTASSGSRALDNVNFKTGSASIQLTSLVGGAGQMTYDWGAGATWLAGDNFQIYAYVPDVAKISSAHFYLKLMDTTGAKIASTDNGIVTGWNLINIKRADFTLTGGFAWTDPIRYLRLNFTAVAGETAVISFDSFYTDVQDQPALVFTFDDCLESVYTYGYGFMKNHHIPGTFYVWTDQIGGGGKVTAANLLEMKADRWCIANHTANHTDLTTLSEADAETEIIAGQTALTAAGITGNDIFHLSYPGGAYNATVEKAASDANCLTGCTIFEYPTLNRYRILPLQNAFQLWNKSFGHDLSLAQAKTWVDTVFAKKEVGILLFHSLITGTPSTDEEWNKDDFEALLVYIASLHIPCITVDELYRLQSGSVVVSMPK